MFDVVPRAVSRHIFVVHHTALLDVDGQANVCPSSREDHLPNFGAPHRDGGRWPRHQPTEHEIRNPTTMNEVDNMFMWPSDDDEECRYSRCTISETIGALQLNGLTYCKVSRSEWH